MTSVDICTKYFIFYMNQISLYFYMNQISKLVFDLLHLGMLIKMYIWCLITIDIKSALGLSKHTGEILCVDAMLVPYTIHWAFISPEWRASIHYMYLSIIPEKNSGSYTAMRLQVLCLKLLAPHVISFPRLFHDKIIDVVVGRRSHIKNKTTGYWQSLIQRFIAYTSSTTLLSN